MKPNPNRILRYLGYEIRRIPQRGQQHLPPDSAEIAVLNRMLKQFASTQPDSSSCSDVGELRRYLSNRRIAFFNDVVRLCQRHRIDLNDKHIADIGSGTGYLLRAIHQAAPTATLTGFDTISEMKGLTKLLCPSAKVVARSLYDVEDNFDVILCTETLEHLIDPNKALSALAKLVNAGGSLVITVPNGRLDQTECGQPRDDGTAYWGHINFWSPESWRLLLKREFGADYRVECGKVATGENFGIIFFPENR